MLCVVAFTALDRLLKLVVACAVELKNVRLSFFFFVVLKYIPLHRRKLTKTRADCYACILLTKYVVGRPLAGRTQVHCSEIGSIMLDLSFAQQNIHAGRDQVTCIYPQACRNESTQAGGTDTLVSGCLHRRQH